MNRSELMLWVIFPYACLMTFVLGHIWRYRREQFNWTTRSTQILERKLLQKGILLFHVGLLMVIGGHVMGLLVPSDLTAKVGVTDDMYHWVSVVMGAVAGTVMLAGFVVLVIRRLRVPRVAQNTSRSDQVIYTLLTVMVITGMLATVKINLISGGYHYRETVSPWFRGIFTLGPDGGLMSGAPLVYQIHALAAMLVFAFWPFSRLIHAWSVPLKYLGRSPILYRSRSGARPSVPSELNHLTRHKGTSGVSNGSANGQIRDGSSERESAETTAAGLRVTSSQLVARGGHRRNRGHASANHPVTPSSGSGGEQSIHDTEKL